tara:strand:+ start:578152 stop:580398 length:2247 start_codon:yes stop_codon:yes gene_type:complete
MIIRPISRRKLPLACALGIGILFVVGCGDPIRSSIPFEPSSTDITLTASDDVSKYEWPMTREGFVVAKPPQMAFVSSFDEPVAIADRVTAEVVPWSKEGIDPDVDAFLTRGFVPSEPKFDVKLRLKPSQLLGKQAFDLSADGTRLVVIDREGLALYNAEDGSLLGHRSLPAESSDAETKIEAVRFCGETNDFLIASESKIYRISGKDGSIVSQSKGCGESIQQWIVTPDGTSMIIRTKTGRLFGGDTMLDYFAAYFFRNDQRFDAVSLSFDGSRFSVCADSQPQTYFQTDYQITDHRTHEGFTLDADVDISCGLDCDLWADGDGAVFSYLDNEKQWQHGGYPMFWRPVLASACSDRQDYNWFLMVGHRLIDGKEQIVLFEFGPRNRIGSEAMPLTHVPQRIEHDASGATVALFDQTGLQLVKRETWRSDHLYRLPDMVYGLINQGKFDQIEKMLEIIGTQKRLGYGRTPEELRVKVINEIAARWRYLVINEPDGDYLKAVQQWHESGSPIAIVSNGVRHYRQGWDARGSGTARTVTQSGWKEYGKHLEEAEQEFELAVKHEHPPLIALSRLINVRLEHNGDLDDVDALARRAFELYPGEKLLINGLAFKLLPQWFGERGDCLSFILSCSKMIEGASGDLLYARLLAAISGYIHSLDTIGWKSYDSKRAQRGVEEWIRIGMYPDESWWILHSQFYNRTKNIQAADRVLKHLIETTPAPPWRLTDGESSSEFAAIRNRIQQWRQSSRENE